MTGVSPSEGSSSFNMNWSITTITEEVVFSRSLISALVQTINANKFLVINTEHQTYIQYNKNCQMNTFLQLSTMNRLSQWAGPSKTRNKRKTLNACVTCSTKNCNFKYDSTVTDLRNKEYYKYFTAKKIIYRTRTTYRTHFRTRHITEMT